MRRCYMVAGHNALRRSGLGQKHAVNLLHWLKWGVLIFGSTGSVHYPSVALSNLVSASCSRAGLKLPVIRALGKMSRAPSSPKPCVRSCWPERWRRSSLIGVPEAQIARVGACTPLAWPAGSQRGHRPRATFASSGCPLWRCARDAPCRHLSLTLAPSQSRPSDHGLI